MKTFILDLKDRNETLFYFGLLCLLAAGVFMLMTRMSTVQVYGVNAWYKPFKFAFSTFLFAWAMGWYCWYLPSFQVGFFNWTVILLLGFEIAYIAWMAAIGQQSHFNNSSPFHAFMFSMMAMAASLVTLYTAYVGFLFFAYDLPELPRYYLWGIRLGLALFVVFAFQGFVMGARMSHSVGLVNDNSNLFIVGWSRLTGDLRIAHFIGMHALQVLPVLAFFVLKSTRATLVAGALYVVLATFTLVQALQGKPLFPDRGHQLEETNQNTTQST